MVDQKKRWFYTINPHFFRLEKSGWPEKKIRVCRTTFLKPLFYTFLDMWLQNKWSNAFWSVLFRSFYVANNFIDFVYGKSSWLCKLGFFFLVNHFSPTWKKLDLWYKTTFFSGQPLFSNQISRTIFLQPDFSNLKSQTAKIEVAE